MWATRTRTRLNLDESRSGRRSDVPPSANRRAPDRCDRRSLWRAGRHTHPCALRLAHSQPPVADRVAVDRAHVITDVFGDAVPDGHAGDAKPDSRAPVTLAHSCDDDDRSGVFPAARWQRWRGRERTDARSGPPNRAQERGDGYVGDGGASRGTIG